MSSGSLNGDSTEPGFFFIAKQQSRHPKANIGPASRFRRNCTLVGQRVSILKAHRIRTGKSYSLAAQGGCSECTWFFSSSGPPTGNSLDEMMRNFQLQLSEEFASHACANHHRIKKAEACLVVSNASFSIGTCGCG